MGLHPVYPPRLANECGPVQDWLTALIGFRSKVDVSNSETLKEQELSSSPFRDVPEYSVPGVAGGSIDTARHTLERAIATTHHIVEVITTHL